MSGGGWGRLQRLCSMEVPGTFLATVLYHEVRRVIPCDAMTLVWTPRNAPGAYAFHEAKNDLHCGEVSLSAATDFVGRTSQRFPVFVLRGGECAAQIAQILPDLNHAQQNSTVLAVSLLKQQTSEKPLHSFSLREKAGMREVGNLVTSPSPPPLLGGRGVFHVSQANIFSDPPFGVLLLHRARDAAPFTPHEQAGLIRFASRSRTRLRASPPHKTRSLTKRTPASSCSMGR